MIFSMTPYPRGLLIGLTIGVLLGLMPCLIVPTGESGGLAACIPASLGSGAMGALIGGFVRMTGCLTAVGALIGLTILGMLCEWAIRHPQGVMYGVSP